MYTRQLQVATSQNCQVYALNSNFRVQGCKLTGISWFTSSSKSDGPGERDSQLSWASYFLFLVSQVDLSLKTKHPLPPEQQTN